MTDRQLRQTIDSMDSELYHIKENAMQIWREIEKSGNRNLILTTKTAYNVMIHSIDFIRKELPKRFK